MQPASIHGWLCRAKYQAIEPNTAASTMRSPVESRTAPNLVEVPPARATAPSTRSSITKPQIRMVPVNHQPRVKKINAAAVAPTVPAIVISSGVTPARASRTPSGLIVFDTHSRA